MQSLEEHAISCPYCGERITVLVDTSAGDQEYIEDCQVCCRPIVFQVSVGPDGVAEVFTFSENE